MTAPGVATSSARQDIEDLVAEVEVLREINEINQQTLEVIVNKMHN